MRWGENSRSAHRLVFGAGVLATLLMNFAIAQEAAKPAALPPMPANADPAFEVATIKPSDTSAPHGTFLRTEGRHSIAYNFAVRDLICFVYGVHKSQIVDGPKSLLETRFDIDGVPDIDGRPNIEQRKIMYRKLLASRFKLAFHREKRELPAYVIEVAKGGPRLTKTDRKPGEGTVFSMDPQIILKVRNASISDFAHGMQEAILDKPVVDQTGLRDRYDFDLKWTPDEGQLTPVPGAEIHQDSNAPPGLYTAIQEQLGLRIESKKAAVDVLVIDHLEDPSPN
ncbi:MAG TPA: TIGR03435 family protein [Terracidiphilus sp.]|nr:TIGR03435 family protein [Terracidiphilus sp.]